MESRISFSVLDGELGEKLAWERRYAAAEGPATRLATERTRAGVRQLRGATNQGLSQLGRAIAETRTEGGASETDDAHLELLQKAVDCEDRNRAMKAAEEAKKNRHHTVNEKQMVRCCSRSSYFLTYGRTLFTSFYGSVRCTSPCSTPSRVQYKWIKPGGDNLIIGTKDTLRLLMQRFIGGKGN